MVSAAIVRHGLLACLAAGRWLVGAAIGLTFGLVFGLSAAQAEPVKGSATFSKPGDYARLVLQFGEEVPSEVKLAGSVLIIYFKTPVTLSVERLADAVPDYVATVRRDPDGTALRMALVKPVKVNSIAAGERLFVDLLPANWSGLPPGLPQDVVEELAERARAAEKLLRQQRQNAAGKKPAPVRVRASLQPTFARYVFEVPDNTGISTELGREHLKLLFDAPITFDLADALILGAPNVSTLEQQNGERSTTVDLSLIGDVNVHSFREEKTFVVDVAFSSAQKAAAAKDEPVPAFKLPGPLTQAAARTPAVTPEKPAEKPAEKPKATETPPATEVPHSADAAPAPKPQPIAEGQRAEEAKKPEPAPAPISPPTAAPVPAPVPAPTPATAAAAPAPAPVPASKTPDPSDTPAASAPVSPAAPPKAEAAAPPAAQPASEPAKVATSAPAGAAVEIRRGNSGVQVIFPMKARRSAALFRRADALWFVVDSAEPFNFDAIRRDGAKVLRDATSYPLPEAQAILLRLDHPQLASLDETDKGWAITFADSVQVPVRPLHVIRNIADPSRANVIVPFDQPGRLHRFNDPEAGDALTIVTAPAPARGFIKRQDFVEFRLLETMHGVVVQPMTDDVAIELASDKVVIGRPGGLTLSAADVGTERAPMAARPPFDIDLWRSNRTADFSDRQRDLVNQAAQATDEKRFAARLDLARFYFARGLYPEAKSVLDVILSDSKTGQEDATATAMRAVANILIGHVDSGVQDLASPAIGTSYDSQLWKAVALARQQKWPEAREKFKNVEFAISALPVELQRLVIIDAMRAALEVKDFASASGRLNELEVVGVSDDLRPEVAVLRGRLAEALGRDADAAADFREALRSSDRKAASEATLRDILLRNKRGELKGDAHIAELEALSVVWRGDAIEVETLANLARLYAETGRYRDALLAVRTATRLDANSALTRALQDDAAGWFAELFIGSHADTMPPVEALALFYEFREWTPIGRHGDEMIRRLADRLAAIDLLDQACDLLQYQISKRLEGAARAQVAARLATFYLMNRKPERAVSALRTTRVAELNGELRQQRLLLEARAQSDLGRHDLALDIVSNLTGRETIRLRSDIYWAARRWRESSEQIEVLYGERWRDFQPLSGAEKSDILRAAIGYALAEDSLGIARVREKYGPMMTGEADKRAFDVATRPVAATSAEFAAIAKMAASVDTLDGFLQEMKQRFPDATAKAALLPRTVKDDPVATGSLPAIPGLKRAARRP